MIKAFIAAFSMYSKIPMPQIKWDDDTLKYALCFFPLVGVIIGGAVMLFYTLLSDMGMIRAAVCTVIPVVITGGIHLDGLMDTSDALASYRSRERKLEIMSDPHTGAFAVIAAVCYMILYFAFWCEELRNVPCVCAGFVLSRALSGLCLVLFPKAKKDGLGAMFAERSAKTAVGLSMVFYIIAACALMLVSAGMAALCPIVLCVITVLVYYITAKKNFGGVTGDTAGWFLCWCEFMILAGTVLGEKFL